MKELIERLNIFARLTKGKYPNGEKALAEAIDALEQSATEIKGLKDEIAELRGQVPRYISPAQFHAEHHLWWKVTEHGTAFIVLPYPFKNIQQPTTNQSALHAEGGKEI
jgi:hypothetical protein